MSRRPGGTRTIGLLQNRDKTAGTPPRRVSVLTIAGADSAGAAGIQADLRTFAAFGLHGVSVITAVTAQNTRAVRGIHLVPVAAVREQLRAVAEDFDIGAVKIGMLGSAATIDAVADFLARRRWPVVLDPVLVSSSGAALLPARARGALRARLLPRAQLITPNLPEAAALLHASARGDDPRRLAAALLERGANAVLLKGGHADADPVCDYLVASSMQRVFRHKRLPITARGTGCTLSAAIAAALALGMTLADAVRCAEDYLQRALRHAYRAGRGRQRVLPPQSPHM